MTFTASLILDLVILALLVYAFVTGFRRGLILSLCSLLAVFVALLGGWYLSTSCADPLAEKLEPLFLEAMADRAEADPEGADSPLPADQVPPEEAGSFSQLTGRFSQAMQERLAQSAQEAETAALSSLAASAAALVAKSLLFLAGFLGVLVLWLILCHALNLVAKLPGLHGLNKVLGGLLGLGKGILLLMVARWALCDLLGWIPAEVAAESHLLPWLGSLSIFSLLGE